MTERSQPPLSPNELRSMHETFSHVLITRGKKIPMGREFPSIQGGEHPHEYRLYPSATKVKQILYPRDNLEVLESTYFSYLSPHRIDPDRNAAIYQPIIAAVDSNIGKGVHLHQTYYLDHTDGVLNGEVATQYERNGRYISPNNVRFDTTLPYTNERWCEVIDDALSLNREMTFDDAQKLRQLFRSL